MGREKGEGEDDDVVKERGGRVKKTKVKGWEAGERRGGGGEDK